MAKLIIPGRLIGLNEYILACRANRYKAAGIKKRTQAEISLAIIDSLGGEVFTDPVRLAFRWYEPNAKRDLDNICFAKKFILDALVETGTIANDNWKHVKGFTDSFFIDKDEPRVEVDINGEEEDV